MVCHFCQSAVTTHGHFFPDYPDIAIVKCNCCNLVQASSFEHLPNNAYRTEDYLPSDLNLERIRQTTWNLGRIKLLSQYFKELKNMKVLDYGCGSGGFLDESRPFVKDVVGFDLCEPVAAEHRTRGFRCFSAIDALPQDFDLITLFHVLEHTTAPWTFLKELTQHFSKTKYFVLEVPNTNEALRSIFNVPQYHSNHFTSQHLYYFDPSTFKAIVQKAGLHVEVDTLFQRYTLANHFGWLKNGKGGGQDLWPLFNDEALNDAYAKVLIQNGTADSIFLICSRSLRVL